MNTSIEEKHFNVCEVFSKIFVCYNYVPQGKYKRYQMLPSFEKFTKMVKTMFWGQYPETFQGVLEYQCIQFERSKFFCKEILVLGTGGL